MGHSLNSRKGALSVAKVGHGAFVVDVLAAIRSAVVVHAKIWAAWGVTLVDGNRTTPTLVAKCVTSATKLIIKMQGIQQNMGHKSSPVSMWILFATATDSDSRQRSAALYYPLQKHTSILSLDEICLDTFGWSFQILTTSWIPVEPPFTENMSINSNGRSNMPKTNTSWSTPWRKGRLIKKLKHTIWDKC